MMQRTGNRRKWKRTLPILLAAVLWAEGMPGNVYAAPETGLENMAVAAPEEPEKPEGGQNPV